MRRFVHAAVFAVAISAPVLTGAPMDHSVVSVLGTGAKCSSSCTVGGTPGGNGATQSGGAAQGGHLVDSLGSASGTIPVVAGPSRIFQGGTGRNNITIGSGSSVSGNFNSYPVPSSKGHCTGGFLSLCS